jgi:hypothetical protein
LTLIAASKAAVVVAVIQVVLGWGTLVLARGIIAIAPEAVDRVFLLPPAIGFSRLAARLKRWKFALQLYEGKRPLSKGIGGIYEGLWCFAFQARVKRSA